MIVRAIRPATMIMVSMLMRLLLVCDQPLDLFIRGHGTPCPYTKLYASRHSSLLTAHFFLPRPHVGDAALVARDDDFGALGDLRAVLAARGRGAAVAVLRKNNLADAVGADRARRRAEDADHAEVGRIEVLVGADQHLGEKIENDRCAGEAGGDRRAERDKAPEHREARQEIAGAAEPGEERGDGADIDMRDLARMARAVPARVADVAVVRPADVEMEMRDVDVERAEEREEAENESQREADEIEIRPSHGGSFPRA